ncbi:MAG: hypothetical protein GC205_04695 [Bacteroidetes bacterium]|nr:hypothetical protein [Bacteroidota bacterium]
MLEEGKKWQMMEYQYVGCFGLEDPAFDSIYSISVSYTVMGDTLISGTSYKILRTESPPSLEFPEGDIFLREDTAEQKIYQWLYPLFFVNQDTLIYDFKLSIGEFIDDRVFVYANPGICSFYNVCEVVSVDTVSVFGVMRKRIGILAYRNINFTCPAGDHELVDTIYHIEGIGSSLGFNATDFTTITFFGPRTRRIICVTDSEDNLLYQLTDSTYACDTVYKTDWPEVVNFAESPHTPHQSEICSFKREGSILSLEALCCQGERFNWTIHDAYGRLLDTGYGNAGYQSAIAVPENQTIKLLSIYFDHGGRCTYKFL